MNTTFSLVYFECCKNPSDLINVTNGPFLFKSKEAAQEKLLVYVRNRIAEAYPEAFADNCSDWGIKQEESMTPEEVYSLLLTEKDKLTFDILLPWFNEIANDEVIYFGYKIDELPTSSFIEDLKAADAIEVDDHFIRHFHLEADEQLESNDDILLDATVVDDDMDKFEYYVSLSEANDATFNPEHKYWNVGGFNIRSIQFSNN